MTSGKNVWVVVLPRCGLPFNGGLYTGGDVLQMPEDAAKRHGESEDGSPAMVAIVKNESEGHATYKKLRKEYFMKEHGRRKPDNMPNEEQLSKLYGGVAA